MANLCSVCQDSLGTSNLSLNPDAPRRRLRAVRSRPVSLVRWPVQSGRLSNPSMVKESDAWLEASDVVPMFPTLVWKTLLKAELGDAIDANVLATLEQLRRNLPTLNPGDGWQ